MVDIRPMFIRHPEAAVGRECEAYAVDGDVPPAWTRAAEAITCKDSHREDGEAEIGDGAKHVGIKTGQWGAIGTGEANAVFIDELEVWFQMDRRA